MEIIHDKILYLNVGLYGQVSSGQFYGDHVDDVLNITSIFPRNSHAIYIKYLYDI